MTPVKTTFPPFTNFTYNNHKRWHRCGSLQCMLLATWYLFLHSPLVPVPTLIVYYYMYQRSHVSKVIWQIPVQISSMNSAPCFILCHNRGTCLPRVVSCLWFSLQWGWYNMWWIYYIASCSRMTTSHLHQAMIIHFVIAYQSEMVYYITAVV